MIRQAPIRSGGAGPVQVWDSARGVYVPQRRPIVGRGRGPGGLGAWQLSSQYCNSDWSLLNPLAWFGGCITTDAGNLYQKAQYGTLPPIVAPPAPSIALGVPADTPGAVYADSGVYALPSTAADSRQAMIDAQNQAIDQADWNPAGNLPFTATGLDGFLSSYGSLILITAVALFGMEYVTGGRRR